MRLCNENQTCIVSETQCISLMIFLLLRFYVKSVLTISEAERLPFDHFGAILQFSTDDI